ncbi:MAG: hypothetical protein Q8P80_01885 [Candidatus Levybacteria bacterium]|nr:hypothetical protein [Candidatus Levybacteria bacterium]
MPDLNTISHLFFLFLIILLGIYSWFYNKGAQKTKASLGIKLPGIIERIMILNLFLSMFALLIGLFFMIIFRQI